MPNQAKSHKSKPVRPLQRREIQALYESKWTTISELAAITGLPRSRLYRWRREDRWSAPESRVRRPELVGSDSQATELTPQRLLSQPDKARLVERLFGVVENQMSKLEAKLYSPEETAVDERDNRTLGQLARTLEKLLKMDNQEDADGQDTNAERELRTQLEARIARALQTGKN